MFEIVSNLDRPVEEGTNGRGRRSIAIGALGLEPQ